VLEVGRVVKPHGLRGQVVVELWTNRTERMDAGSRLEWTGGELLITKASPTPGAAGWPRWIVTFAGIETREEADRLRGGVLRAEPIQVDGALWVHELVGAVLHDPSGTVVGTVESVEANPASDLLVLDDGRMVPLTFVARDDQGRLTVDGPPGLLDLEPGEA
jgi:16S rRNA processing protein RimM